MVLRTLAARLIPTEHRRFNEFIGLLILTIAILLGLSLVSFNPDDPSFNISFNPQFATGPTNFIGPVGAYIADVVIQAFGYSSFLLPIFIGIYAFNWLTSRSMETFWIRVSGMALLILTLCGGFALWPSFPRVRGHVPGGGLFGQLISSWMEAFVGPIGAVILLMTTFLVSLFLLTRFSFEWALGVAKPRLQFVSTWSERYQTWREERANAATKQRIDARRMSRKQAAAAAAAPAAVATATVDEEIPPFVRKPRPAAPKPPQVPAPKSPSKREGAADLPPTCLLHMPAALVQPDEEEFHERARLLEQKAAEFDVIGAVQEIHPGPVVTTFEFKPEAGVKYARITSLSDDISLAFEAEAVRIDRMPGKSTVGIEVPNEERATIVLREIIEAPEYTQSGARLPLGLGKDITGKIIVSDLQRMPHLLMAGSTGTGKSVSVNALILSLLYRARPDQVKLIMIDPKRLELGLYQDIPHLLVPVVTEPKIAQNALRWAVMEMESRYKKLARRGVRNLEVYNEQVRQLPIPGLGTPLEAEDEDREPLPYIVIVIDELADLMMTAAREVEESITRLAQMARAVGIHMVLATQRPSVDVITGLIKANFPARISFRVASKVDSRTILDSNGAEQLLGRGDMLFVAPGSSRLMRVHGPLVTEDEVMRVVEFLKKQGKPVYNEKILESPDERREAGEGGGEVDELYEDAVKLVVEMGKASTSALQRRLRIGYGRAASLLDAMEREGIVGPPDGSKPREVLIRNDKEDDGL